MSALADVIESLPLSLEFQQLNKQLKQQQSAKKAGQEKPRAKRDLYFLEVLNQWNQAHANFSFTPVLSEPDTADQWQGRTGWVHEAVMADHDDLSSIDMYASGPPPMIDALKSVIFDHGLTPDRLFYDSFEFAVEPDKVTDK